MANNITYTFNHRSTGIGFTITTDKGSREAQALGEAEFRRRAPGVDMHGLSKEWSE